MVDRVQAPAMEGITNTPADNAHTPQDRPSWLPENFNSPEDLWKSYQELRADHTRKAQELSALKQSPTSQWQQGGTMGEQQQEQLEQQGYKTSEQVQQQNIQEQQQKGELVTKEQVEQLLPGFESSEIEEISNYAWENQQLSEEHYQKLERAGYSRAVVDQFMQGQFAVVEAQRQQLINAGGGESRVADMFTWAQGALSRAEIDNFNARLDAGGPDAVLAMETLGSMYDRSGRAVHTNSLVSGANAPNSPQAVFRSTAQVIEAMNDPRYKSDPAYRRMVEEGIARSNVL